MKMRDKPVGWLGSKGWGNPIESEWTQGMTCSKTFTSLESTMFYISLTSRWTSSLTIWTLKFWSYFHLTIMSSNLQTSTHRTKMCILLSLQIVSHVKHHTMFVFVTLHKKTYSLTIIFHPKNSLLRVSTAPAFRSHWDFQNPMSFFTATNYFLPVPSSLLAIESLTL